MINIREEEFLCDDGFVVRIKEHYLFKWCYKREELHCYNQRIINEFTVVKEPKKPKKIGFVVNSKQSKKRKKNEDKSKTDKS